MKRVSQLAEQSRGYLATDNCNARAILWTPVSSQKPSDLARASRSSQICNSLRFHHNIRFVFDPEKDYAEFSYTARESWKVDCQVGLDGVRRLTETNDSVFAVVGEWIAPDTFRVQQEIVGYSSFDTWEFKFNADEITVTEFSLTGDYTYNGRRK